MFGGARRAGGYLKVPGDLPEQTQEYRLSVNPTLYVGWLGCYAVMSSLVDFQVTVKVEGQELMTIIRPVE